MTKAYCGAKKATKSQHIGTEKECIDKHQIRHYGLEKINANLLNKIKKPAKKKVVAKKEVHPIELPITYSNKPGPYAEQSRRLHEGVTYSCLRYLPQVKAECHYIKEIGLFDKMTKKEKDAYFLFLKDWQSQGKILNENLYQPMNQTTAQEKLKTKELLKFHADMKAKSRRIINLISTKYETGGKFWNKDLSRLENHNQVINLIDLQDQEGVIQDVRNVYREYGGKFTETDLSRLQNHNQILNKLYGHGKLTLKEKEKVKSMIDHELDNMFGAGEPDIIQAYQDAEGDREGGFFFGPKYKEGNPLSTQKKGQKEGIVGNILSTQPDEYENILKNKPHHPGIEKIKEQRAYQHGIRKAQASPEFERLIAQKPESAVPYEIQEDVDLLTGNAIRDKTSKEERSLIPENDIDVIPFGSWTYKTQFYPGDVDLITNYYHRCVQNKPEKERVGQPRTCANKVQATNYFVDLIQNIIRRIQRENKINDKEGRTLFYIGDIKAGEDKIFKINIGKIQYNNQGYVKVAEYFPEKIHGFFKEWHKMKLISVDEMDKFIKMSPNEITQEQYENLYAALREKWLLRWKVEEILKGYKDLPGKRKKTLGEAINDPAMTKIDMFSDIFGKFIEVTNVMQLWSADQKKRGHLLNFNSGLGDESIPELLRYDVQKLLFSVTDYKLFKAVKRVWSIARLDRNREVVEKLIPILQSDLGRISQASSEIETLGLMLGLKNPPLQDIAVQLEGIRYRLSNVYKFPIDEEEVDHKLIQIEDAIENKDGKNSQKEIDHFIDSLKKIKKRFTEILNEYTEKELKKIKFWPIPAEFLPHPLPPAEIPKPFVQPKEAMQLTKEQMGQGLYTSAANIYRRNFCNGNARPLLDNPTEYHPGCYNFCGANTHIDDANIRDYKPYNNIDNICRTHDIDYYEAEDQPNKADLIRAADIKMLRDIEKYKGQEGYNLAKAAISSKIRAEDLFPNIAEKYFPQHSGRAIKAK